MSSELLEGAAMVCSNGCSMQQWVQHAAVCAAMGAAVSSEQRAVICMGRVLALALESGSLHLPKHIYCLVMTLF